MLNLLHHSKIIFIFFIRVVSLKSELNIRQKEWVPQNNIMIIYRQHVCLCENKVKDTYLLFYVISHYF